MNASQERFHGPKPTIFFYAHCSYGVGHVTRTMHVANALKSSFDIDSTIITCSKGKSVLRLQGGIKVYELPPFNTMDTAHTKERVSTLSQRITLIRDVLTVSHPAVFVVDHMPVGLDGELSATLLKASRENWDTKFVFGMPYGPQNKHCMIRDQGTLQLLSRYDAVFCYAADTYKQTIDTYQAIGFPMPDALYDIGVVTRPLRELAGPQQRPLLVGLAGGGTVGKALYELLLAAVEDRLQRGELRLRLLLGPLAPPSMTYTEHHRGVEVIQQAVIEDVLDGASAVVSRSGYNISHELMQTSLPTVFCPNSSQSREQEERADKLQSFENVWVVSEQQGVKGMRAAIDQALAAPHVKRQLPFCVHGTTTAAARIVEMAGSGTAIGA